MFLGRAAPLLLASAVWLAAPPARAAMIVQDYQAELQDPSQAPALDAYIQGLAEGFAWMNAEAPTGTSHPRFCLPGNEAPPASADIALLNSYIQAHGVAPSDFVGAALLLAFEDAYPCH